ncbi:MAG: phosphate acyltransferase, partial [Deltaproteobacteria bacterium]|nr:phosphate acyltransferase [Deltaproteobacteria bacterium]
MVVAVDAMGSDNAPDIEVKGAVDAAGKWGIPIILIGDSERIQENLKRYNIRGLDIRVQHASEIVTMNDHPADAVRRKKDSSIRVAFELVKRGEAQAVVSAGNSGATLAAGMFILKRLPGIDRPAIATIFPSRRGRTLILDVGGTVDCKPHQLAQFAFMGDLFARHLMKKKDPVVGLLSNGSEESKGVELTREAHLLLK